MLTTKVKNITYFLKQKGQLFFLSLLCLYSAIVQFFWLKLDTAPPWGDGIPCILRGMHFFQVQDKLSFLEFIKDIFGFGDGYPPLVDFSYFLYYRLFGLSSEMELMVNSVYLVIGIIGIYGIGKYLFDKNTGLFSALIFTSLPGVLLYSKLGFKEFQLMCFLALTIYFLLESKNFTNRKFSLLFAVSLGLMMMIKYEGLIFLIAPLSIVFIKVVSDRTFTKNLYWSTNLKLVLIIVSLIGLSWYIVNWQQFSSHMFINRLGPMAVDPIGFSTKDLTYYFKKLLFYFLSGFYMITFVIICITSILKMRSSKARSEARKILLFCFYLAFSLLVFTFISGKNIPHISPLLVFVSVIIGGGCSIIKNKSVKSICFGLIFLHAVQIQLMPLLAADYEGDNSRLIMTLNPINHFLVYSRRENYGAISALVPIRGGWDVKLKQMLNFIKEDYCGSMDNNYRSNKKPSVLLLYNKEPFRFFQLVYYNMKKYSPIELVFEDYDKNAEDEIFCDKYRYIITGAPYHSVYVKEDIYTKNILKFINENPERFHKDYIAAYEIELPRALKATIYKKVNNVNDNKSILQ